MYALAMTLSPFLSWWDHRGITRPPVWGASYHRDNVPARGAPSAFPRLQLRLSQMVADPAQRMSMRDLAAAFGVSCLDPSEYGATMDLQLYADSYGTASPEARPGVPAELGAALTTVRAGGFAGAWPELLHQWFRSLAALAAWREPGVPVVRGGGAYGFNAWTVREGLPTSVYFTREAGTPGVVRVVGLGLSPDWPRLCDRVTTSGRPTVNGFAADGHVAAVSAPPVGRVFPPLVWTTPPTYGLDIAGE